MLASRLRSPSTAARARRPGGSSRVLAWGPSCQDGTRAILARVSVALPGTQLAVVAEAWGCRVGLEVMMRHFPALRSCRVIGDNLAGVRYCAGHGRTRRPEVQAVLEGVLGRATACGWQLSWVAVGRRLNEAADAAAARGAARAAALAADGLFGPQVEVWFPSARGGDDPPLRVACAVDGGSDWWPLSSGRHEAAAGASERPP